jgi:hypothetical protein
VRWSLTNWLGLIGGYNFRYSSFGGPGSPPPLARNTVYIGVSGYFANDQSLATLWTFTTPTTPP